MVRDVASDTEHSCKISSGVRVTLRSTSRLHELDSVRAIAIVSMTFGHVSNYSFLWLVSHPVIGAWDGASLFVLVSGLVIGLVYRRRIEQFGVRDSAVKLIRRAGFLYVAQLILVSIALALGYFYPSDGSAQFTIPGAETFLEAFGWALILEANPIYVNFLSLYVLLLLAVVPVLVCLHHRRFALLAVLLSGVYLLGLTLPSLFTLRDGPNGLAEFNVATWFVLFSTGVWMGWVWRQVDLESLLNRRKVIYAGVSAIAIMTVVALFESHINSSNLQWFLDKGSMSPGRFLAAWIFFLACYWLVRLIDRLPRGSALTDQMAILGARSLDAVVILTLVTVISQGLFGLDSASRLAQVLAVATVLFAWAWSRFSFYKFFRTKV